MPDTELKTVYVKSGRTTEITWENIPITGQIQIIKKSADYNPTTGLPAGRTGGAIFEIYDRAGNLVDTIRSDSRGLAVSKQLPCPATPSGRSRPQTTMASMRQSSPPTWSMRARSSALK